MYSKIQFEMENAIKRYQRLEGDDHFLKTDKNIDKVGMNTTTFIFKDN